MKVKLAEKDGQVIIGQETFRKVLEKFERSKKANYDMIVKANSKFQEGVFKFCLEMIEKEQFPEEFNETILHMIFKGGKGKKEVLSDNRFIHSKSWMPSSVQRVPEPDPIPGISFATRPDPIQF